MILIITYFFIVGLIFGSFFNVVGLRIPENISIIKPRSSCPKCNHILSPLELIPVFSFLLQRGKCKKCHTKISVIYPIFELFTGILFAFSFCYFGFTLEIIVSLTLVSLLMIIVISDYKYMIIPDKVLMFFGLFFILERIFIPLQPWWSPLLGAVVGFGLLLFIAIISKGGMGGGDIKLFAVLGMVLGWKLVLFSFFMSTLFGAVFGLIGMLFKKIERGKPIPFGPYIALGTFVSYFYGEILIGWYSVNFLSLL